MGETWKGFLVGVVFVLIVAGVWGLATYGGSIAQSLKQSPIQPPGSTNPLASPLASAGQINGDSNLSTSASSGALTSQNQNPGGISTGSESGSSNQAVTQPQDNSVSDINSPAPQTQIPVSTGVKFADSPLAPYSFKVAPGAMDAGAKRALSGYTVTQSPSSDGSTTVYINDNYSDQLIQVALQPGYTLYVIEKASRGNDREGEGEGDDGGQSFSGFVMVDPNGFIVQN